MSDEALSEDVTGQEFPEWNPDAEVGKLQSRLTEANKLVEKVERERDALAALIESVEHGCESVYYEGELRYFIRPEVITGTLVERATAALASHDAEVRKPLVEALKEAGEVLITHLNPQATDELAWRTRSFLNRIAAVLAAIPKG